MAQMVKSLSTMKETWVRSLGWEDPLEKEMAPHSSTISWKIPWTEEPARLRGPWGRKELDTTERPTLSRSFPNYLTILVLIQCCYYKPGNDAERR